MGRVSAPAACLCSPWPAASDRTTGEATAQFVLGGLLEGPEERTQARK